VLLAGSIRSSSAGFSGRFNETTGYGVATERGGVVENAGCCLGA